MSLRWRTVAARAWRTGLSAGRVAWNLTSTLSRANPVRLEGCRSVALFFPHRIGDFVLAAPAIETLGEAVVARHRCLAVRPSLAGLASRLCPGWDTVALPSGLPPQEAARRVEEAAGRLDAFVDLTVDESLEGARIARAGRYPMTAGFTTGGRGGSYGTRLGSARTPEHLWRVAGRVVDHLAPGGAVPLPNLVVSLEEQARGACELDKRRRDRQSSPPARIGLAPGGTYSSQQWAPEAFAAVGAALAGRGNVYVIGSPAERELVEAIAEAAHAVAVWDLPMELLPGALASLDLLVCNNSGPLHLAAAVGTPTLSLMGPTDPVRFWPLGPHNRVLRLDLPCSPCGRGRCASHRCLRDIPVASVVAAASEVLDAEPRDRGNRPRMPRVEESHG